MTLRLDKLAPYAPIVLRVSLALLFLWFSVQQFLHPRVWEGFVPDSVVAISHLSAGTLVFINGVFELIFGTILLIGFWTRWAALFLALHLFDIAYTIGYDSLAMRDLGLAVATLSIFFSGPDWFTIDLWKKKPLSP